MTPIRLHSRVAGLLGLGVVLVLGTRGVSHAERTLQTRREVAELRIARQHLALRTLSEIEAGRGRTDSLVQAFQEAVIPAAEWESGAAELGTLVREALMRFGAVIESISPVPRDTTLGSVVKPVSIRVVFQSELQGVVDLFAYVNRARTILVPRSIQIVSTDAFAESSVPEVLKVELVITGWYINR